MTRGCRLVVLSALVLAALDVTGAQVFDRAAGEAPQIAGAFPRTEPGPLERRAVLVTPDNPVPRQTRLVNPAYPEEAAAVGVRASIVLRVTVDHLGTVPEVRASAAPVLGVAPAGVVADQRAFTEGLFALVRAAKDAVGQWLYDPPAEAPLTFDVVIAFTPEAGGQVVAQGAGRTERTRDLIDFRAR